MTPNEYQDLTRQTEIYSDAAEMFLDQPAHLQREWLKLAYCCGKLNGEAGEAAEVVFKAFRGNQGVLTPEEAQLLKKELGDILWYVSRMADLLGYSLEGIMQDNIRKLMDRKNRGVLHGYGDER